MSDIDFSTPMMQQYAEIKKQYQDCILFFRLGDFYEMFLEDAHLGAKILDITLTSRPKGKDGRIPMAGVPFHAVDSYLGKLIKAGHKVAICEQVTPPDKYGIVERKVVRIVTPGTVMDDKLLDQKQHNYVMALLMTKARLGLAWADISTGAFLTNEYPATSHASLITQELVRFQPNECILPPTLYDDPQLLGLLTQRSIHIFPYQDWERHTQAAEAKLLHHFETKSLESYDLHDKPVAQATAAMLLGYLEHTQQDQVKHLTHIKLVSNQDHVLLDTATIRNLELLETVRDGQKQGSLLHHLDHTSTGMGGRLLRQWLLDPLNTQSAIEQRLDAVEELITNRFLRERIEASLSHMSDIERLLSRLSVGIGTPRDLIALKLSLQQGMELKATLPQLQATLFTDITKQLHPILADIATQIEKVLIDQPPISTTGGGLINSGINPELDRFRNRVRNHEAFIRTLEASEREKTGIPSLKIGFNQVFGYYIEISKANLSKVPKTYIRKQTMVNAERFITPEIKAKEEVILTTQAQVEVLENQIYHELVSKTLSATVYLQQGAEALAHLDCLVSLAIVAEKYRYTRPQIVLNNVLEIQEGRHPVVENLLKDEAFVPNDTLLDPDSSQLHLITGPNMAGKSVYIRQVALIALMAHLGSFVPAKAAQVPVMDRLFVRSGAADVITAGLSTFMVEMVETAFILNHATSKSLIIMDEIGRGTSTYDGISLAWAIAHYLVSESEVAAKTLFATHYHELQALETDYPGKIVNYHVAIEDHQGDPIFLHKVLPGGSSHSFGIAVAKLAGVPKAVTDQAKGILKKLEQRRGSAIPSISDGPSIPSTTQEHPSDLVTERFQIIEEIKQLDVLQMTPLEAMNKLAEIKGKLS